MQKTEKTYYFESHIYECEAVVLQCEPCENGFLAVLNKTCIFPEGGGQPSDMGYIGNARVCHATEKDGIIYHQTDKSLEVGKTVTVKTDVAMRIDHSCQHTGEHIISGIAHKLFGAVNVGFHMAEDYSTLDLDIMLSDTQLAQLEAEANKAVWRNIPVTYKVVDAKELKQLSLRKKTEGLEDRADEFRIVYIGDVDSCTCCATHCAFTGEVGIIKFNAHQKYKNGMRIWFLCGERAYADLCEKQTIVDALAKRFSTKQSEILSHVISQGDENVELKRELKLKSAKLAELSAVSLFESAQKFGDTSFVIFNEQGVDMNYLKVLCEKLCGLGKCLCIVVSENGGKVGYVVGSSAASVSASEICKVVNATLNGKGGGKADFAQGSATCGGSMLQQGLAQLNSYVSSLLRT